MDSETIAQVLIFAFLAYSVILHEIAHGYIAELFHDYTARKAGRITLNPIPHLDLWWTFLIPAMMFYTSRGTFWIGGPKPVPVNIYNLRPQNLGYACVSLGGVTVNFVLAVLMLLAVNFFPENAMGYAVLKNAARLNILLCLFNLIPIPPLDGSRMIDFLLNEKLQILWNNIGRWGIGFFILIIVLNIPEFGYFFFNINNQVFNFMKSILLFR
jgi:Zn-dependent protease